MSSAQWLQAVALGGCAFYFVMARRHAVRAATALRDTKAAIAAWWRDSEAGR